MEDAATNLEVAQALFEASQFGVSQAEAALEEAQDQLAKTIIMAPMSGKVTRLNVEAGETVVIGTMNNAGSLILTISDLSVVEAVMEVDETDVPEISLGDSAVLELDAFPNRVFTGRVTEIGNSAIRPPSQTAGTGQTAAIDFEVVITLDDPGIQLRPDLSATADIITAIRTERGVHSHHLPHRTGARGRPKTAGPHRGRDHPTCRRRRRPGGPVAKRQQAQDIEGVFVVREGVAHFTPVEVGITGQEYFEVISGVQVGDTVVAGPYQRHPGTQATRIRFGPWSESSGAVGESGSVTSHDRPLHLLRRSFGGRPAMNVWEGVVLALDSDQDGEAEELLLPPGGHHRRHVSPGGGQRGGGDGPVHQGGLRQPDLRDQHHHRYRAPSVQITPNAGPWRQLGPEAAH